LKLGVFHIHKVWAEVRDGIQKNPHWIRLISNMRVSAWKLRLHLRLLNPLTVQYENTSYEKWFLKLVCARSKALIAVAINSLLGDVMPCGLVEVYWHFGGTYCLCIHGQGTGQASTKHRLPCCLFCLLCPSRKQHSL
jgi:hypothetical protein